MNLITTAYGDIQYEKEDLILLSDGLFGFSELTEYLLICLDEEDSTLLILQSVQKPEISFAVITPVLLCPDYSPVLTPEELFSMGVEDSGELSYYAICIVKKNWAERAHGTVGLWLTVSLSRVHCSQLSGPTLRFCHFP